MVEVPGSKEGGVEVDRHCVSLVDPLPDKLDTGFSEILNLEVVGNGENVLYSGWTERDRVEVHVVNYLRRRNIVGWETGMGGE